MRSVYDGILSKVSVRPQAATAAVNGTGVDTMGFSSAMIVVENGAATGAPTTQTVDAKVQESADNSTFTDVTGATITQMTASSKSAQIRVEGLGTSRLRYLRVVVTPAFTGGTTPAALISANILLGRAQNEPVANSATPA
jgi:hypothetical protein